MTKNVTNWDYICKTAKDAGAKFPELVAAQWALESNYGQSVTGKFNFFGIKGKGTKVTTQEWEVDKFVTVIDEFKDYASPADSVIDLVTKWYKDYQDYKGVNSAGSIEDAAKELYKQGYATDPDYSNKLLKLVKENQKSSKAIDLLDAVKFYKAEPHQVAAWRALEAQLTPDMLDAFAKAYRGSERPVNASKSLAVPYYWQRDSVTGHGERMCQSSSIAMVIDYLHPGIIDGDDDYLDTVLKYGDTVSQSAHLSALNELGFNAKFRQNGDEQTLDKILEEGRPVAIGILHKGFVDKPTGGGHWIVVTGKHKNTHYVCNDPFGELDLLNGGYPKNGPLDGKNVLYSRKNLMKRWLISSLTDGWYWDIK